MIDPTQDWTLVIGCVEVVRIRHGQSAMQRVNIRLDPYVYEALAQHPDIKKISFVLTYANTAGSDWSSRKVSGGWLKVSARLDARGIARSDEDSIASRVELFVAEVLSQVLSKYRIPHPALQHHLEELIAENEGGVNVEQ